MLIAQVFGLIRFVLEFIYPEPGCGVEDTRISFLKVTSKYSTIIILMIARHEIFNSLFRMTVIWQRWWRNMYELINIGIKGLGIFTAAKKS